MPKRKRQPEEFDVGEFLRESDDDLKSAIHSLLGAPQTDILIPDSNIDSPINLAEPTTLTNIDPPLNLIGLESQSRTNVGPAAEIEPEAKPDPPVKVDTTDPSTTSIELVPEVNVEADLKLIDGVKKRQFAIREMSRAADAHTRAEQHVYQRLWDEARPYDEVSRAITMGFGTMANLVGLSESNARINLRNLVVKLAVEEIGEYNCERSVGRTYRILNEVEILRRRREAGLRWYMRRTLAVVFVDPATGQPLLKSKPLRRPGVKLAELYKNV
jgi:hypothetical protein